MPIPTPHINAPAGAFAETVLMPGDPKRSEFVAKEFLTGAVLVNDVRGVRGYTGMWKNTPVSVMASGMGIPSSSIYTWELFGFYDVDNIIRIGTAGAIADDIELMDIVAAQAACTNSHYVKNFGLDGDYAPIADFELLCRSYQAGLDKGVKIRVGNIYSSDNFYYPLTHNAYEEWRSMGVLATEMEAAGLYANAAYFHKKALCLCTISDHLFHPGQLSPQERETGLSTMIEIALDTAVRMDKTKKK